MSMEKPKKEYNFIGKDLTPEKKEEATYYLEGRKKGAAEAIEGEYKKTPEDLMFIKMAKDYFKEQLLEIGVKNELKLSDHQIHFLPKDIFNSFLSVKSPDRNGMFIPINQGIYINKDRLSGDKLGTYKTLFHEITHMASYSKFEVAQNTSRPVPAKSGYSFSRINQEKRYMDNLNELMVEQFVSEFFYKNQEELVEKFKFDLDEDGQLNPGYYPTEILHAIINKIAIETGEEKYTVWKRLEKGLFTGNMMHLRDIERIFGPKSLRALSELVLVGNNESDETKKEEYDKVLKLFQGENKNKQDQNG